MASAAPPTSKDSTIQGELTTLEKLCVDLRAHDPTGGLLRTIAGKALEDHLRKELGIRIKLERRLKQAVKAVRELQPSEEIGSE